MKLGFEFEGAIITGNCRFITLEVKLSNTEIVPSGIKFGMELGGVLVGINCHLKFGQFE